MNVFDGKRCGRCILLNLRKGEDILDCVEREAKRLHMRCAAVVSGIGALRRAVYHRIATLEDEPTNEFVTVEAPIEMSALQGLILDGEAHLHITCCAKAGAFAGHLERGCEVQYLAEICILEMEAVNLTRMAGPFGVRFIEEKGTEEGF